MQKLSPWILNILRLGAYQLLYMDKVPPSAACNESVSLAGRYGHKASAGFVNAVLRNIARNGAGTVIPQKDADITGYLTVKYSYPKWLVEKYSVLFGNEFTEMLLDAGNGSPELTVRVNTLKVSAVELLEKLKYAVEALIIGSTVSLAKLEAF